MRPLIHTLFSHAGLVMAIGAMAIGQRLAADAPAEMDMAAVEKEVRKAVEWRTNYPFAWNLRSLTIYSPKGPDLAEPFRFIDGKFTNLVSEFERIANGTEYTANPEIISPGNWSHISGTVIQAGSSLGLLVLLNDQVSNGKIAALKNYPFPVVDKDAINCVARYAGITNYVTVNNSVSTIRAFDFGTPLPEELSRKIGLDILDLTTRQLEINQKNRPILSPTIPRGKTLPVAQVSLEELERRKLAAEKRQKEAQANAIAFLRKRIADGSIEAARDLAERYRKGQGVEIDEEEAKKLTRWADAQEAATK